MSGMVIVGGGLAAGTAARILRKEGYQGPVTVVAQEPKLPYQRPPLSKGYLQGTEGLDQVILKPESWYREQTIDVRPQVKAVGIDRDDHRVSLSDGQELTYDKLLLATGATARTLPGFEGALTLRTLADADALAPRLQGRRLVVVGSGWIGMEVAATARQLGADVTVLSRGEVPLSAALGEKIGREFQRMHEEHGVKFQLGVTVEGMTEEAVRFDGQEVPADVVVVGVGATLNLSLAEAAGLELSNGVLTDSSLVTSDPDILAAGDIANSFHPGLGEHLRVEHWSNALAGGKVAARTMLGQQAVQDEIPYFYTDQYDLGMELSGYPPLMKEAEIVIRGDLDTRKYLAFWVREGKVVGGMNVNIWDINPKIQQVIGQPVEVLDQQF